LRIELSAEGEDLLLADATAAEFDLLADRKVLEITQAPGPPSRGA